MAKVVVIYLPIQPKADLRAFRAAAAATSRDAAVVGMTTGGAAFIERGVTHEGAVAAVFGGDQATPEQLICAAEKLASHVSQQIGATLRGALVFDCAARRNVLGDRYPEQAQPFTAGRTSPTVGVPSYG